MKKISELTEHINDPSGAYVPIVVGGVTKKLDASRIGNNSFVNVGNYGVTAGGSASANATGFAAALLAAAATGKDVFCPFSFTTNPLTITQSNIKIFGRGQQTVISQAVFSWPVNTVFIDVTGNNVTIENITINGHATNFSSSLNVKGIRCNTSGLSLFRCYVTNFEDAFISSTTGVNISIANCLFDNIGGRVVYMYLCQGFVFKQNVVKEWARHTQDCSGIELLNNVDNGFDNVVIAENQMSNPNNSSKFFIETPGGVGSKPVTNIQIINERYDGGGFTTGCVSCYLQNAVIINPVYKNFGRYAFGAECSGDDIKLIGGDYGNTVLRMGTGLATARKNLLISGCIFNSQASSPIDGIITIHGNDSSGTPSTFQNLVIENCVFNSSLANNVTFVVLSGYMTLNDFLFSNNTIYGNASSPPAIVYFTTNGGSRFFIRNNNVVNGDGWVVTDRGIFNGLVVHNNFSTGELFHPTFNSTSFPQYVEFNNIASDSIKHLTGTGSPEGVQTARIGSTYHRKDGGGGTCFYVKESGTGNTGWVAK
jgi:hypothetical protein